MHFILALVVALVAAWLSSALFGFGLILSSIVAAVAFFAAMWFFDEIMDLDDLSIIGGSGRRRSRRGRRSGRGGFFDDIGDSIDDVFDD